MEEIINCVYFDKNKCVHYKAPEKFFGQAKCLLLSSNRDKRITCAVMVNHPKPKLSKYYHTTKIRAK
jgi:hypothetical protein